MTSRREIALVWRREARERFHSRAFQVGTAIQLAVVIGAIVIASVTDGDGAEKVTLGVVGQEAATVGAAARERDAAFDLRLTVRRMADERAARAAVKDDLDAALVGGTLLTTSEPQAALLPLVQTANRDVRGAALLRREGVSPNQARAALDPPPLRVTQVESGDEGAGIAFVGSLLLYLGLITFGYTLAGGIVEEKSSRVIEVVLSAIKPVSVLTGKVIGIGLVGLAQLSLIGAAGAGAALATGHTDLPSTTASSAIVVAVFFVLGYALYACAFAVAGAVVSRQEDIQSTTSPLLVLLVGSYLASISALNSPSGTLAEVLTYVPPAAPLIVPGRVAQDAIGAGEVAISIALMLVSTALLMRLAVRIYERSILLVGAPLKLTQAWRLARSSG